MKRHLTLGYAGEATADGRLHAASAERNAEPILSVLRDHAPPVGRVLELASGTGQHAVCFAAALPGLIWQPSDSLPASVASIAAWTDHAACANLRAPLLLDATLPGWAEGMGRFDMVFVANIFHLIDRDEAGHMLNGIAALLPPDGVLIVYGPFLRGADFRSDGDRAFDARLKEQDPAIGYKADNWICAEAGARDLDFAASVDMPAANLMMVFRRGG